MEVLARYCTIPGYHKLCCESCSRKTGVTTAVPGEYSSATVQLDPSLPTQPPLSGPDPPVLSTTPPPLSLTTKANAKKPRTTVPGQTMAAVTSKPIGVSTEVSTKLLSSSTSFGSTLPLAQSTTASTSASVSMSATRLPSQDSDGKKEKARPPNSTLAPPTSAQTGRRDSDRNLPVVT
ncbi:hypothetical protein NFI96_009306 [Prochilodus magdalenae]|nr:hypothetical protein NFI96_009306 [Prochilodus magdalenae]